MLTTNFTMNPKKVPRCTRCGARAYWASRPVCLVCALKEEKKDD